MTKVNALDRLNIIKGLHTLLSYANSEGYFLDSLYDGIEDGGNPEDEYYLDLIMNDDSRFEELLNLYLCLCARAGRDGGFFGLLHNGEATKETTKGSYKPNHSED